MLDYQWGNQTTIMLNGDEPTQESSQSRQILEHFASQQAFTDSSHQHQHHNNSFFPQPSNNNAFFHHQHPHNVHSLFDPRAYGGASPYAPSHHPSMLSMDHVSAGHGGGGGYLVIPKSEDVSRPIDFASRIGLNLGIRTYFSSADDDFVNRLYRRSRPGEPGSSNLPRCQAEGCNADLTHAKHYHRRHKVCEFHSKASTVITAGLTQRFCQQCSRFHVLSEFDNGKRSCRKRLADHNRRRRKSQQPQNPEGQRPQPLETACNSWSENVARSPPDSGIHSSSSVTVAVSPPRMSLDCFRQGPYHHRASAASSSASQSSLFFSSG